MSRFKLAAAVIVLALSFTTGGWTQGMRGSMGQHAPRLLGDFKPVVGSGAQYQMTVQNRPMTFAYVIVGKEDVEGGTGYWMETRSQSPQTPGETVMKQLMVLSGDKAQIKRLIMQTPGRPPMEMPAMMLGMGQHAQGPGGGDTSPGEKVGTESITVPAGTFQCDHYQKQQQHGTVDTWTSAKVSPYGTVKMTSGEITMVLEKTLSNETSHVQGEPQKMNLQTPHF